MEAPGYRLTEQIWMGMTPTYLLGQNYQLIDWNWAFDELIAAPHKLERGHTAADFVRIMDNRKEVLARTEKVFAIDATPFIDFEVLVVTTPPFGQMHLRKIATTVYTDEGDPDYWVVCMNIDSCENSEAMWEALEKRMTTELKALQRS